MIKVGSKIKIGKAIFEVVALEPFRKVLTVKHPKERTLLEVHSGMVEVL